jgi:hypothetical protein
MWIHSIVGRPMIDIFGGVHGKDVKILRIRNPAVDPVLPDPEKGHAICGSDNLIFVILSDAILGATGLGLVQIAMCFLGSSSKIS